ncbi:LacI family transcriptional regulator [Hymenobacter jejuensis]|uniref:LacI family transcriptional regulator n=1 Tax=Hymenobacter jejuensis TaxID=2502781 RepID=A0A5B8A318_9BACT|nr:LacI family transcriptional regulator [Hymenobacter jejuensis]
MASVNLKRLAQELNLSISTVSRALSDSYEVSQETKDRVRALAQQLNYEPNPYASSLRRQRSKTIGVVIPEVANNFFSLAINGIEEIARYNGYHVLIYLTHDDYSRELSIAQHLASGRADGILMSVASESLDFSHLDILKTKNVPLVFFDRVCEEIATANVTTDDYDSGYKATEHLISVGCRSIAYLLVSSNLSIGQKRMQGYLDALRDHGLAADADLVVNGGNEHEQNVALIKALLQRRPDIDGLFASVESLAMSSYQACQDLQLSIPQDIKIISFSNLEIAALLGPSLTTITQPAYDIGKEAAKILFQAITKNRPVLPSHSVELKSELIVRGSTTVAYKPTPTANQPTEAS